MEDSKQLNIDQVIGFLRRRGAWIVVCTLLAGACAFLISKSQQKEYTASAAVIFNEDQLTQEIAGLPATASNVLLQHASNLELLDLDNLASTTAAKLGHGLTEREVSEAVSINGSTESNIAGISVTDPSPRLAARIANAYASEFVRQQGEASSRYYESALKLVRKQIAGLTAAQRNQTAGFDLYARAHSLALLAELQPNSVEVVQRAQVPAGPSAPTTAKNTLIGLVLGAFLGIGLALLAERVDPRIRRPQQLADAYGVQLLGTVPSSPLVAAYELNGGGGAEPDESEAFQVIRAQLSSFTTGPTPGSILISSARDGEGKSTVAFHLAGAAAQAGSRVLLIEADFRRPSLAARLGLGEAFSLVEATISPRAMEYIGEVPVGPGDGVLRVMPAGKLRARSLVGVLDSEAMDRVLSTAATTYDLVVVDGPSLSGVSDAFLLMAKVDGLVVVGAKGRARRDVAEDLSRRLRSGRVRLFGVVANRVGRGRRRAQRQPAELDPSPFGPDAVAADHAAPDGAIASPASERT